MLPQNCVFLNDYPLHLIAYLFKFISLSVYPQIFIFIHLHLNTHKLLLLLSLLLLLLLLLYFYILNPIYYI